MKLSVVISARNEYPILLATLYSFYEDLIGWARPGRDFEFVVVDNASTDATAAILRDRFPRWLRIGLLQVHEEPRPGNMPARNIGAQSASGEVLILADAHLSVAAGSTRRLYDGARTGGLWHPAAQIWGDTEELRTYGYHLRLREKFWGDISFELPAGASSEAPFSVPMASNACLAVLREPFLRWRGYHPGFRVYGGGEPYLALKWWMMGSRVMLEPRATVRHAFGLHVDYVEGKPVFGRNYLWKMDDLHHNFLLAAWTIGGYAWFRHLYGVYARARAALPGGDGFLHSLRKIADEALAEGEEDRAWFRAHAAHTLDSLLEAPPWMVSALARGVTPT